MQDMRIVELGAATSRPPPMSPAGPAPPVDAAGVVSAPTLLQSLIPLGRALDRWPWLVPCVAVPPQERETALALGLLIPWHMRLARCPVSAPCEFPVMDSVRNAVAARAAPTPNALAAYVCQRLGTTAPAEALIEEFEKAFLAVDTLPRSPATYSRIFARLGSFNAQDWRHVAWLASHLASGVRGRAMSPLTELRLCRRYLRMPPGAARARLVAWEHVVEVALRNGRYVLIAGAESGLGRG
jgi:hypothetical protein